MRIPISKPYLPDRDRLDRYLDRAYETGWLSNGGPLLEELSSRLVEHLGVPRILLTANGTLALQVAYRVLGLRGEAITTPFSFVATTASLEWEGVTARYTDIQAETLNIDPNLIAAAVTDGTSAIVGVHVFGNPVGADVDEEARSLGLRLVFDAAHAFGVEQGGRSVLLRGDASVLSFHATKLFHTAEGGAVVFADPGAHDEAAEMINFGIDGPDSVARLGLNAKMNELEAAMGLAVLDEMATVQAMRAEADERYEMRLGGHVRFPAWNPDATPNHGYRPVLLDSDRAALAVRDALAERGIQARRYFHPSLDTLPYSSGPAMPVSRTAAATTLCLPLYAGLAAEDVDLIAGVVIETLEGTP